MNPPIMALSPVSTNPRLLMFASVELAVAFRS